MVAVGLLIAVARAAVLVLARIAVFARGALGAG